MKRIIVAYFLVCSVILASLIIKIDYGKNNQTEITKATPKDTKQEYILKSDGNTVKLYKAGKYIKTYNISPSSLPLTDQDNLRSGIILEDYSAVLSLIEDFDS